MTVDDSAGARRPNVLMILTDQQRWDSLGAAGNPVIRTPNMDRLAAEGVRCSDYFVSYPQNRPYGELYDLDADPSEFVNCWDDPSLAGVKCDLLAGLVDLLTESQGRLPLRLAPN